MSLKTAKEPMCHGLSGQKVKVTHSTDCTSNVNIIILGKGMSYLGL